MSNLPERPRFEIPPLKAGEMLQLEGVEPAMIVHVFDARENLRQDHPSFGRGYIGVRESGNVDVFWHRWVGEGRGFRRVLVHNGGPKGFDDIERPMRQCVRMVKRYIGIEETVEERQEEEEGERELKPPITLRDFAESLHAGRETILIPGHEQWVASLKWEFDRAIREITVSSSGAVNFGGSVESLKSIRQRLDSSKNPYLRQAGDDLEEALASDDRFKQFAALRRGGGRTLSRMAEIDDIVLSIMVRHGRLEAHRGSCEDNLGHFANEVFRLKGRLDKTQTSEEYQPTAARIANLSASQLPIFITNPFKERAGRLNRLPDLGTILETDGRVRTDRVLNEAAAELSQWKEDIKTATRGRFADRFPVAESNPV